MESIKKQIIDIQISNYEKSKVANFLESQTYSELFSYLIDLDDENFSNNFHQFMEQLLRNEHAAEKFLMDSSPSHKALLQGLLSYEDEKFRQLIPIALESYIPQITAYLNNADDSLVEEYLGALFLQLNDDSTSVGFKILKIFEQIIKESKKHEYKLMKSKVFLNHIEAGLKHTDSVIAMRYLDLLIFITNQSEELFKLYNEKGFGDFILQMFKTDDLLVKLVVVESIHKLGDSNWNANFIATSPLFHTILNECFDKNSDLYIQKNLLILISKLISRNIIAMDHKLKTNIIKQLIVWFNSGFNEEIQGALDSISHIVLRHEVYSILLLF